MSPEPLRIEGVLRSWNDERGFGFLASPMAPSTFAHISAFDGRPQQGERFSYVIGFASDGRPRAEQVQPVGGAVALPWEDLRRTPRGTKIGLLAIAAFAVLFAVLAVRWNLPLIVAAIYAAVSLVTFLAYAIDKAAARANRRRVSEAALLGLGVLCGWPGGLLAQQLLRHKRIKRSFQSEFWLSVLLNVVALVAIAAAAHYDLLARLGV